MEVIIERIKDDAIGRKRYIIYREMDWQVLFFKGKYKGYWNNFTAEWSGTREGLLNSFIVKFQTWLKKNSETEIVFRYINCKEGDFIF